MQKTRPIYVTRIAVSLPKHIVESLGVDRLNIGSEARQVGTNGRLSHQILQKALASGAERASAMAGVSATER